MFSQRIYNDQENIEEPNFNPGDFPPSFLSNIPLDSFGTDFFARDDQNYYIPTQDLDFFEQGLPFMIDPSLYQAFQEDIKRYIPGFDLFAGFVKDGGIPDAKNTLTPKPVNNFNDRRKIGTITAEERRIKVNKFLEKRKRRIFTKRISYACRKRVADSRIRIKGRFVTKEQASALVSQSGIELKKEEE